MRFTSQPHIESEIHTLQQRALRRRRQFVQTSTLAAYTAPSLIGTLSGGLRSLPLRFILHALVALLVPVAALMSASALTYGLIEPSADTREAAPAAHGIDFVTLLAPLGLNFSAEGELPAPDSAFAAIDALPIPALSPDLLAVRPVQATIEIGRAHV